MAIPNMVAIQTVTVGSGGTSSIVFNSIPQTYTDLKIVVSGRADSTAITLVGAINGSTSNFTSRFLYGDGSTPASSNAANSYWGNVNPSNYTASTFGSTEIYIPNYTSSNNKSFSVDSTTENNATGSTIAIWAGLWSQTAAITSITLTIASSNNFVQYTTATLYGISSAGIKASGGIITYDGTYVYHKFTSSGTFTPFTALSNVDYLVVAGGGGGGNNIAGAGGAGGLRCTVGATGGGGALESKLSLSATNYTVTIGAGGAASTTSNVNGNNGSNSVFGSITSTGGGGGGSPWSTGQSANTGGSGGGAGGNFSSGASGGSGTANQGYAGGNSTQNGNPPYVTAGGGGAGAVGGNANGSTGAAGAGGNGIQTSISGIATYYAGGGGGSSSIDGQQGSGGLGGGGNAGVRDVRDGTNGDTNTGGGGAGGTRVNPDVGKATNGGSGIVIIRYPA